MSEKVNESLHPIFNAHACDKQALMKPLLNARPFNVYKASHLIEKFVYSAIANSSSQLNSSREGLFALIHQI